MGTCHSQHLNAFAAIFWCSSLENIQCQMEYIHSIPFSGNQFSLPHSSRIGSIYTYHGFPFNVNRLIVFDSIDLLSISYARISLFLFIAVWSQSRPMTTVDFFLSIFNIQFYFHFLYMLMCLFLLLDIICSVYGVSHIFLLNYLDADQSALKRNL